MPTAQNSPILIRPIAHRTKTTALQESLTELTKQLGPGAKLPTVRKLAASFRVSTCTLDRVLANLERQNLIVRKHSRGVFVSDRVRQRTIALVYGEDIFRVGVPTFCAMLLEETRRRAASKNEHFSFYLDLASSKEGVPTHRDLMDDAQSGRLSGILFAGAQNPHSIAWLQQQRIPLVALSCESFVAWRVAIDFAEIVRLGVQTLLEEGCRRIAFLPSLSENRRSLRVEESEAFTAALRKADLEPMPGAIWNPFHPAPLGAEPLEETNEEIGYRATEEIFGRASGSGCEIPDGLASADDTMTRGAAMALQKLGLRVGRDVKVATHANRGSPTLQLFEQEMIRVEVDPMEIVNALFMMIETLMDGKTPPSNVVWIRPRAVLSPKPEAINK